jgi:hypothetical protein
MSHKSLIQHFSNLKILCYEELLTAASTSLEPLIITVPPNHQTGFLCCSYISTEPKNQYITGSKMNRPNTDANATVVFLTLLLTHYQTKGTRNFFLIIRNVVGATTTRRLSPESWWWFPWSPPVGGDLTQELWHSACEAARRFWLASMALLRLIKAPAADDGKH